MRLKVVELAIGYWRATIEGEEADAVIDRSPDQALASLVRANMRRLGVEAITYEAEIGGADERGSSIPFGPAEPPILRNAKGASAE